MEDIDKIKDYISKNKLQVEFDTDDENDDLDNPESWFIYRADEFIFYEKASFSTWKPFFKLNTLTNEVSEIDTGMKGGVLSIKVFNKGNERYFGIQGKFLGQTSGIYTFDMDGRLTINK